MRDYYINPFVLYINHRLAFHELEFKKVDGLFVIWARSRSEDTLCLAIAPLPVRKVMLVVHPSHKSFRISLQPKQIQVNKNARQGNNSQHVHPTLHFRHVLGDLNSKRITVHPRA